MLTCNVFNFFFVSAVLTKNINFVSIDGRSWITFDVYCVLLQFYYCVVEAVLCVWPRRLHYSLKINKALRTFYPICHHLHRGRVLFLTFLLPFTSCCCCCCCVICVIISFYVFSFSLLSLSVFFFLKPRPHPLTFLFFFLSINRSTQIADLTFCCFIGFMRPYHRIIFVHYVIVFIRTYHIYVPSNCTIYCLSCHWKCVNKYKMSVAHKRMAESFVKIHPSLRGSPTQHAKSITSNALSFSFCSLFYELDEATKSEKKIPIFFSRFAVTIDLWSFYQTLYSWLKGLPMCRIVLLSTMAI